MSNAGILFVGLLGPVLLLAVGFSGGIWPAVMMTVAIVVAAAVIAGIIRAVFWITRRF